MTTFIIADQEPKVCSAVGLLIENHPDWTLAGAVHDPEGLAALTRSQSPDVVILDRELPDLDLEQYLADVFSSSPESRVILLSKQQTDPGILDDRIQGVVAKNSSPERVIRELESLTAQNYHEE